MSASHRVQKIQNRQSRSGHQAANLIRPQQIRDTEAGLPAGERTEKADRLKECFESFQLKYDIDRSSPWWKKFYFWCLYLPFARFSFLKVGIVPPDHLRCIHCSAPIREGAQLGWLERQTVWSEKWRALKDAERYRFGGVEPLPFDITEQEETCAPLSQFPNSTAREQYEQLDKQTVPVQQRALARLSQKLLETDPVVNRYRPKSA